MDRDETRDLADRYGIPLPKERVARSPAESADAAEEIGYPVALKLESPDVAHKTEAGGIELNLVGGEAVREAHGRIVENAERLNARVSGVLVQEQVPEGREVIVGGTRDRQFGPVVMFGLGGIFVEVLEDVSFRVAPIDREEAAEMVREIKGYPVLEEFRGKPAADVEALEKIVANTSRLMQEHTEITELDVNPLIVHEEGAHAVDVEITTDRDNSEGRGGGEV